MARVSISEVVTSTRDEDQPLLARHGASVQVNIRDAGAADVYAGPTGASTLPNPLTSDHGRVEGWLNEGSYDLVISFDDEVQDERHLEAIAGTSAVDRRVVARSDEPVVASRSLGDLAALTRRLAFVAPCPCRVRSLGIVARSTVPVALGDRWDMVWRKLTENFLSTEYADAVLAQSPIRYYEFDEAIGEVTAVDSTGNSDATITGPPTLEYPGAPVGRQSGIYVDGTGAEYVRAPSADLALGNELAIELWVAPDGELLTGRRNVLGADDAAGTARAASRPNIVLITDEDGRPNAVGVATLVAGVEKWVVKSENWCGWRPGDWNLITYSRLSAAAGTDELMANGIQLPVTYPDDVDFVDAAHRLVIGRLTTAVLSTPIAGGIDEVAIYPTAQSLADHQDRYGVIATKSTAGEAVSAHSPWLALETFSPTHELLNTGDCVWLEANPMYEVGPLLDATSIVTWEVI